ncbi:MAG: RdgB/HAM1 family non-canonical purine NTP pyrophosphatase [Candidatus Nealsonbacteria bacterium]
MQLYFITSSENKIKEVEDILGFEVDKILLDINEIQTLKIEEVVKDKAKRAFEQVKKPVMVEDTGFYIEAWQGFPGALIKWILKTLGNEGLCLAFQEKNRTVTAKTSICLYNGKEAKIFTGEIKGQIPEKPRGEGGFGWDPIFQPEGYNKTFAEMSQEEKDSMSMRKIALNKMKQFLEVDPDFLQ